MRRLTKFAARGAGLLVHDVLPKLILPVHLEHQPAEVAYALLPVTQEGAPLAAQPARRREVAPAARRVLTSGLGVRALSSPPPQS